MVFLDMPTKTEATKLKIDKWVYVELKDFCTAKKNINIGRGTPKRIPENSCKPYFL
jgi:hypothetical protein